MTRTGSVLTLLIAASLLTAGPAAAQAPKPEDMKAEVPALTAMHDVIMPMWHDAWPNKDYKALADFLPKIEEHLKKIERAELPGILRDKRTTWAEGVAALRTAVDGYRTAVRSGNNDVLMKEAERLHTEYERLVRVVRPVLKEMDDFHATLYVLYHYQFNPLQVGAIGESAKILKEKLGPLNAATLSERHKARAEAFDAQRTRLTKAVDRLLETVAAGDTIRITEAVELVHMEYEKLEKIFE